MNEVKCPAVQRRGSSQWTLEDLRASASSRGVEHDAETTRAQAVDANAPHGGDGSAQALVRVEALLPAVAGHVHRSSGVDKQGKCWFSVARGHMQAPRGREGADEERWRCVRESW